MLFIAVFLILVLGKALFKAEVLISPFNPHPKEGSENNVEERTSSYWLDEDEAREIHQKVEQFLKEEKPFLKQGFCLDDLADGVGVQRHRLSACFTQTYQANFNEVINKRRIEYGINMIDSEEWERYTVEGIGYRLGSVSRSTFTISFKKVTGLTPKQYRNRNARRLRAASGG